MSCDCKYITLYKGDDSDFEYNQKVAIVISTGLDLAGCSAHFSLFGFQQDFPEIPEDKTLFLTFPASETAKFPLGWAKGSLWLTDQSGRRRTVSCSILFHVTNIVSEAYGEGVEQAITLGVYGIVEYSSLVGKPKIDGVTLEGDMDISDLKILSTSDVLDMESSDWDFRTAVASVWKRLGGTVLNEES